mmetsp:Transcript_35262/g.51793  ORF Transcript_35262/g.51793 Transcript_35262/m.51793 type:complete len:88 (+) Transcript_35262:285-548(+)
MPTKRVACTYMVVAKTSSTQPMVQLTSRHEHMPSLLQTLAGYLAIDTLPALQVAHRHALITLHPVLHASLRCAGRCTDRKSASVYWA